MANKRKRGKAASRSLPPPTPVAATSAPATASVAGGDEGPGKSSAHSLEVCRYLEAWKRGCPGGASHPSSVSLCVQLLSHFASVVRQPSAAELFPAGWLPYLLCWAKVAACECVNLPNEPSLSNLAVNFAVGTLEWTVSKCQAGLGVDNWPDICLSITSAIDIIKDLSQQLSRPRPSSARQNWNATKVPSFSDQDIAVGDDLLKILVGNGIPSATGEKQQLSPAPHLQVRSCGRACPELNLYPSDALGARLLKWVVASLGSDTFVQVCSGWDVVLGWACGIVSTVRQRIRREIDMGEDSESTTSYVSGEISAALDALLRGHQGACSCVSPASPAVCPSNIDVDDPVLSLLTDAVTSSVQVVTARSALRLAIVDLQVLAKCYDYNTERGARFSARLASCAAGRILALLPSRVSLVHMVDLAVLPPPRVPPEMGIRSLPKFSAELSSFAVSTLTALLEETAAEDGEREGVGPPTSITQPWDYFLDHFLQCEAPSDDPFDFGPQLLTVQAILDRILVALIVSQTMDCSVKMTSVRAQSLGESACSSFSHTTRQVLAFLGSALREAATLHQRADPSLAPGMSHTKRRRSSGVGCASMAKLTAAGVRQLLVNLVPSALDEVHIKAIVCAWRACDPWNGAPIAGLPPPVPLPHPAVVWKSEVHAQFLIFIDGLTNFCTSALLSDIFGGIVGKDEAVQVARLAETLPLRIITTILDMSPIDSKAKPTAVDTMLLRKCVGAMVHNASRGETNARRKRKRQPPFPGTLAKRIWNFYLGEPFRGLGLHCRSLPPPFYLPIVACMYLSLPDTDRWTLSDSFLAQNFETLSLGDHPTIADALDISHRLLILDFLLPRMREDSRSAGGMEESSSEVAVLGLALLKAHLPNQRLEYGSGGGSPPSVTSSEYFPTCIHPAFDGGGPYRWLALGEAQREELAKGGSATALRLCLQNLMQMAAVVGGACGCLLTYCTLKVHTALPDLLFSAVPPSSSLVGATELHCELLSLLHGGRTEGSDFHGLSLLSSPAIQSSDWIDGGEIASDMLARRAVREGGDSLVSLRGAHAAARALAAYCQPVSLEAGAAASILPAWSTLFVLLLEGYGRIKQCCVREFITAHGDGNGHSEAVIGAFVKVAIQVDPSSSVARSECAKVGWASADTLVTLAGRVNEHAHDNKELDELAALRLRLAEALVFKPSRASTDDYKSISEKTLVLDVMKAMFPSTVYVSGHSTRASVLLNRAADVCRSARGVIYSALRTLVVLLKTGEAHRDIGIVREALACGFEVLSDPWLGAAHHMWLECLSCWLPSMVVGKLHSLWRVHAAARLLCTSMECNSAREYALDSILAHQLSHGSDSPVSDYFFTDADKATPQEESLFLALGLAGGFTPLAERMNLTDIARVAFVQNIHHSTSASKAALLLSTLLSNHGGEAGLLQLLNFFSAPDGRALLHSSLRTLVLGSASLSAALLDVVRRVLLPDGVIVTEDYTATSTGVVAELLDYYFETGQHMYDSSSSTRPAVFNLLTDLAIAGGRLPALLCTQLLHASALCLQENETGFNQLKMCASLLESLPIDEQIQSLVRVELEELALRTTPTADKIAAGLSKSNRCTFASTNGEFVEQHWYNCITCGLTGEKGCCSVCARMCHIGHAISYNRFSSFFCDCGSSEGSDEGVTCVSLSPPPSALAVKPPLTGKEEPSSLVTRWTDSNAETLRLETEWLQLAMFIMEQLLSREISPSFPSYSHMAQLLASGYLNSHGVKLLKGTPGAAPGVSARKLVKAGTFALTSLGDGSRSALHRSKNSPHEHVRRCIAVDCAGRLAVGENNNVVLLDPSVALFGAADCLADRSHFSVLCKAHVGFEVLGLSFNPLADWHLAVWGARHCSVVTSQGCSRECRRILPVDLSFGLGEECNTCILKAMWVPGSQVLLAVVCVQFIRVFDLSQSLSAPIHTYYLCVDESLNLKGGSVLRDAVFVSPMLQQAGTAPITLLLLSGTGLMYAKGLSLATNDLGAKDDEVTKHVPLPASIYIRESHESAGVSLHFSTVSGLVIYSSVSRPALALSFEGAGQDFKFTAGFSIEVEGLNRGNESSVGEVHHVAWIDGPVDGIVVPDKGDSSLFTRVKQQAWANMFCVAMGSRSVTSDTIISVRLTADTSPEGDDVKVDVAPIRWSERASALSRTGRGIVWTGTSQPLSGSVAGLCIYHASSPLLLVLMQTGALHCYEIASPVATTQHPQASSSVPSTVTPEPRPDLDVFESLTRVTEEPELVLCGDLLGSCSSEQALKKLSRGNDDYLMSSRLDGGCLSFILQREDMGIAAIRVLAGSASPDHSPRELRVMGRIQRVSTCTRRWYDFILTNDDMMRCAKLGFLTLSISLCCEPGNHPLIDSIEVYARPFSSCPAPSTGRVAEQADRISTEIVTCADMVCRGLHFAQISACGLAVPLQAVVRRNALRLLSSTVLGIDSKSSTALRQAAYTMLQCVTEDEATLLAEIDAAHLAQVASTFEAQAGLLAACRSGGVSHAIGLRALSELKRCIRICSLICRERPHNLLDNMANLPSIAPEFMGAAFQQTYLASKICAGVMADPTEVMYELLRYWILFGAEKANLGQSTYDESVLQSVAERILSLFSVGHSPQIMQAASSQLLSLLNCNAEVLSSAEGSALVATNITHGSDSEGSCSEEEALNGGATSGADCDPTAMDCSVATDRLDYRCDGCDGFPLVGVRFHCVECTDFDLCKDCMELHGRGDLDDHGDHWSSHQMEEIPVSPLPQPGRDSQKLAIPPLIRSGAASGQVIREQPTIHLVRGALFPTLVSYLPRVLAGSTIRDGENSHYGADAADLFLRLLLGLSKDLPPGQRLLLASTLHAQLGRLVSQLSDDFTSFGKFAVGNAAAYVSGAQHLRELLSFSPEDSQDSASFLENDLCTLLRQSLIIFKERRMQDVAGVMPAMSHEDFLDSNLLKVVDGLGRNDPDGMQATMPFNISKDAADRPDGLIMTVLSRTLELCASFTDHTRRLNLHAIWSTDWRQLLCFIVVNKDLRCLKRSAKHLLRRLCKSQAAYHSVRDRYLFATEIQQIYRVVSSRAAAVTLDFPYSTLVLLRSSLEALTKAAKARQFNWSRFSALSISPPEVDGSSPLNHSAAVELPPPILALLPILWVTRLPPPLVLSTLNLLDKAVDCKGEGAAASAAAAASLLLKCGLDTSDLVYISQKLVLRGVTEEVRRTAASFLLHLWPGCAADVCQGAMKTQIVQVPHSVRFGSGSREWLNFFTQVVSGVTLGDKVSIEPNPSLIAQLVHAISSALSTRLNSLSNHPHADIYAGVGSLLGDSSCYMDLWPCPNGHSEALPEKSLMELHPLDSITQSSRASESAMLIQLSRQHSINRLQLRVSDPRGRFVKVINVYHHPRPVSGLGDLRVPEQKDLWELCSTLKLDHGRNAANIDLPLPLVTCNLMFEYAEFHEEDPRKSADGKFASKALYCPRCSCPVTDAHGVCRQCGEVALQCRRCRNINYERLDAFLCVECGYCAYGQFSYRVNATPVNGAAAITSLAQRAEALTALALLQEEARKARQELTSLVPRVQCIVDELYRGTPGKGEQIISVDLHEKLMGELNGFPTSCRELVCRYWKSAADDSAPSDAVTTVANEKGDGGAEYDEDNEDDVDDDDGDAGDAGGGGGGGDSQDHSAAEDFIADSRVVGDALDRILALSLDSRSASRAGQVVSEGTQRALRALGLSMPASISTSTRSRRSAVNPYGIATSRAQRSGSNDPEAGKQALAVQNPSDGAVSPQIAELQELYCNKCRVASGRLQRACSEASAVRAALWEFQRGSSRADPLQLHDQIHAPPKERACCYQCSRDASVLLLTALGSLIATPIGLKSAVEAGALSSLLEQGLNCVGSQRTRALVRKTIVTMTEQSEACLDQVIHRLDLRINFALSHCQGADIAACLSEDMLLLQDMCHSSSLSANDPQQLTKQLCFQKHIQLLLELLDRAARKCGPGGSRPIALHIALPALQILAQLVLQDVNCIVNTEGRTLREQLLEDVLSASDDACWGLAADGRACLTSRQKRRLYLARRTAETWKAKATGLLAPLGCSRIGMNILVAIPSHFLWILLGTPLCADARTSSALLLHRLARGGALALEIAEAAAHLLSILPEAWPDAEALPCLGLLSSLLQEEPSSNKSPEVTFVARALCTMMTREVHQLQVQEAAMASSSSFDEDFQSCTGKLLSHILDEFVSICGAGRSLPDITGMLGVLTKLNGLILMRTASTAHAKQVVQKYLADAPREFFIRAGVRVLLASFSGPASLSLTPGAACDLLQSMNDAISPPLHMPKFQVFLKRAPSQEEYFRGSLPSNPLSSLLIEGQDGAEPTMNDLRHRIAADLDMSEAAELIELLVTNRIMSVNLPLRSVYSQLWRQHVLENHEEDYDSDCDIEVLPPMMVMYRLAGVDGEATEETVECLEEVTTDAVDEECIAAITAGIGEEGGLPLLLSFLQRAPQFSVLSTPEDEERMLSVTVTMLGHCCGVRANRKLLLGLRAPGILLHSTVDSLKSAGTRKMPQGVLNGLLHAIERLGLEVGKEEGDDSGCLVETANLSSQGDEQHLSFLLAALEDPSLVRSLEETPALMQSVSRLLPFLTYGRKDAATELARKFMETVVWGSCSNGEGGSNADNVRRKCFEDAAEAIARDISGDAVRESILTVGFLSSTADFVLLGLPSDRDGDWTSYCGRSELGRAMKVLTGLCKGHGPSQDVLLAKGFPDAMHRLEQTVASVTGPTGLLADTLLEAMTEGNVQVAAVVDDLRHASRNAKRARAVQQRSLALKALKLSTPVVDAATEGKAMPTAPSKALSASFASMPSWMKEMDALEDDPGPVCMICQEGYRCKPFEVLGIYVHARSVLLQNINVLEGHALACGSNRAEFAIALAAVKGQEATLRRSRARAQEMDESMGAYRVPSSSSASALGGTALVSTASAYNVVHFSCHRRAVTADRGLRAPKSEWEGAALRNSRVACNSLLPLRQPNGGGGLEWKRCLDKYFSNLADVGVDVPVGRLRLVIHDIRFLLLQISHGERLSAASGGGSISSNLHLVWHLLQLAAQLLQEGCPEAQMYATLLCAVEERHPEMVVKGEEVPGSSGASQNAEGDEVAEGERLQQLEVRRARSAKASHLFMVLYLLLGRQEEWEKRRSALEGDVLRLAGVHWARGQEGSGASAERKRSRSRSCGSWKDGGGKRKRCLSDLSQGDDAADRDQAEANVNHEAREAAKPGIVFSSLVSHMRTLCPGGASTLLSLDDEGLSLLARSTQQHIDTLTAWQLEWDAGAPMRPTLCGISPERDGKELTDQIVGLVKEGEALASVPIG